MTRPYVRRGGTDGGYHKTPVPCSGYKRLEPRSLYGFVIEPCPKKRTVLKVNSSQCRGCHVSERPFRRSKAVR